VAARLGRGIFNPAYNIMVERTMNGSITVSPSSAAKGSTVTIMVYPDRGYELEMLMVMDKKGSELDLRKWGGEYSFITPAGECELSEPASLRKLQHRALRMFPRTPTTMRPSNGLRKTASPAASATVCSHPTLPAPARRSSPSCGVQRAVRSRRMPAVSLMYPQVPTMRGRWLGQSRTGSRLARAMEDSHPMLPVRGRKA